MTSTSLLTKGRMEGLNLTQTLRFLPGVIIGLTVHEFSHAWVSHLCGDPTSRDQGRMTLNPLKHIDPIGFIMLLAVGFGWAKPVQFNEQNLRNPKRDVLKIAVAGPLSNAITAMAGSVIFALLYNTGSISKYTLAGQIFIYGIFINWGLLVFNLIPIPPLDGSHLLLSFFRKYPAFHGALYKYGTMVLLALIVGSVLFDVSLLPIWPVMNFLGSGFLLMLGVSI